MRLPTRRLAVAAVLAAGLISTSLPASAQTSPPVTADDMVLGRANAPVTVIEYGSAACSHCADFNRDVFPAFKAKYIDTGKVRYVFREALTEPVQLAAAGFMLARCAPRAKYFTVLDEVFQAQAEVFRTRQIRDPLLAVAKKNGMTEPQFVACVTDQKAADALSARVKKWEDEAKFESTPTFDINNKRLQGGHTLADLDAAIAAATKK